MYKYFKQNTRLTCGYRESQMFKAIPRPSVLSIWLYIDSEREHIVKLNPFVHKQHSLFVIMNGNIANLIWRTNISIFSDEPSGEKSHGESCKQINIINYYSQAHKMNHIHMRNLCSQRSFLLTWLPNIFCSKKQNIGLSFVLVSIHRFAAQLRIWFDQNNHFTKWTLWISLVSRVKCELYVLL